MKKLFTSAALLSVCFAFAQEKPKTDSAASTKNLQEVVMTKKVFQKKNDRLVYDVAASPATKGNSAFDLLKETPTVSTSDDKEFKILGKSAVEIYINGRKSNMNSEALLAMLKSTAGESISKIEVISAPGSEFDVPGNTGIINIIMKKKTSDGYSGTLKMENEKAYYDNPSASASLNFRKNKLGGNFSGGYSQEYYHENLVLENGNQNTKTVSSGYVDGPNEVLYVNGTLDYDINEKNYLNWTINTLFLPTKNRSQETLNQIYRNDILTETSLLKGSGNDNKRNISTGLNYELGLDDKGSKLKLNAAYLYFKRDQTDLNLNYSYPELALQSGFNQHTPQTINNISFQGDFIKKFKNESTFAFGGNFNSTKTDNNTLFESGDGITFIKDGDLSNHFIYHENIGALYTNYETTFGKKVNAKAGLRYELTSAKGDIEDKTDPLFHFKNNYGNILPFLNLNYGINDSNALSYSFSSRVRRPSFWELNPVRHYATETNYIQNNPFMLPSKIYNQELSYMLKNAYFFTVSQTYTKDASTQIPLQKVNDNGDVELRYMRTNYGDSNSFSATVGMQKPFFKGRWIANYTVTGVYTKFTGSVSSDPLTHESFDPYIVDRDTQYLMFNANNQIGLDAKKTWWLGVQYFYLTPQQLELGKLSKIQSLNLSLKKSWENWTFKGGVDDVMNTRSHITISNVQDNGYFNNVKQNGNTRTYTLSITYNFGNQKIKGARQEQSANSEIKSRTGGK